MNRNRFVTQATSIILVIFIMVFHVSAASPPAEEEVITIVHAKGETKVKKNAKKVVVFDIGTLETYQELGIPVIGVTNSVPTYLPEYRSDKYAKLGSIMSPDLEKIKALNPDLILISGRQNSAYEELAKIAPTVFLGVDTKDYWESFESNVRTIAKIHGKEGLAEQKLGELRRKRDLVRAKTANDASKTLVVMHVRGGHTVYGEKSRFGFPHDVLGLREARAVDASTHTGFRVPEGFVADVNPEYILLIDRDSAVGADAVRKPTDELLSDEMKQTTAYKNRKIVDLPGNVWYVSGGGLISVDKQITDIGEQLYGIQF